MFLNHAELTEDWQSILPVPSPAHTVCLRTTPGMSPQPPDSVFHRLLSAMGPQPSPFALSPSLRDCSAANIFIPRSCV